ncbi:MAG TPA: hypothetical protein PKY81_07390 [bacterium]|nr:hypothetical protein [bacterium]
MKEIYILYNSDILESASQVLNDNQWLNIELFKFFFEKTNLSKDCNYIKSIFEFEKLLNELDVSRQSEPKILIIPPYLGGLCLTDLKYNSEYYNTKNLIEREDIKNKIISLLERTFELNFDLVLFDKSLYIHPWDTNTLRNISKFNIFSINFENPDFLRIYNGYNSNNSAEYLQKYFVFDNLILFSDSENNFEKINESTKIDLQKFCLFDKFQSNIDKKFELTPFWKGAKGNIDDNLKKELNIKSSKDNYYKASLFKFIMPDIEKSYNLLCFIDLCSFEIFEDLDKSIDNSKTRNNILENKSKYRNIVLERIAEIFKNIIEPNTLDTYRKKIIITNIDLIIEKSKKFNLINRCKGLIPRAGVEKDIHQLFLNHFDLLLEFIKHNLPISDLDENITNNIINEPCYLKVDSNNKKLDILLNSKKKIWIKFESKAIVKSQMLYVIFANVLTDNKARFNLSEDILIIVDTSSETEFNTFKKEIIDFSSFINYENNFKIIDWRMKDMFEQLSNVFNDFLDFRNTAEKSVRSRLEIHRKLFNLFKTNHSSKNLESFISERFFHINLNDNISHLKEKLFPEMLKIQRWTAAFDIIIYNVVKKLT